MCGKPLPNLSPRHGASASIETMQRQLLLLAIVAGCGNVTPPTADAPMGTTDLLSGTLRQGCVLALHMDEGSWSGVTGEVKDDCGGDNPGTVSGTGTTTVAGGVRGRAGSFAGGGCIDIPDASTLHGTTGLTMSAWIFPTQLNNGNNANGVISKRVDSGNQSEYNLSVWTGNHVWVALNGDADTNRFPGNAVISTNVWAQLTMVYDGARPVAQRARVYINGSLDVAGQVPSSTLTPSTSALHVGCMPAPLAATQQNFFGELDEVVIWNRALSDAEIAQWYTNTKP